MNTDTEIPESQSQLPEKITRRSFIKRTTATTVAVVLALHAFRAEAQAAVGGLSGPSRYILEIGTMANFMQTVPVLDENGNVHEWHPMQMTPRTTEDGTFYWHTTESATFVSEKADGSVNSRFRIRVRSRPTEDYEEFAFPETIGQWGFYKTDFTFGFTGNMYIHPVYLDPNGTEIRGAAILSYPFTHTGTWAVDVDGVVTKTPDPVIPDDPFNAGILSTGERVRVLLTLAPEWIQIVAEVAHQAQKDEADPFDGSAGVHIHMNSFSCSEITY